LKLVVDTNVLLGALIKNSTTRSRLLNPDHEFLIPEFALEEVEKYVDVISSKSAMEAEKLKHV
jgi:predicted nucleic acid-binding protein